MNEHFIQGFEKEAGVSHFLGKMVRKTTQGISNTANAPSTAAINFKRGLKGRPEVTTEQVRKAKDYKKLQRTRAADAERKAMEAERRAAEKAKEEAASEAAKKKERRQKIMNIAKPIAAGAAVTGGSIYGMNKLDEYKKNRANENTAPMGYGYYSTKQATMAGLGKALSGLGDDIMRIFNRGVVGKNVDELAKQLHEGKPLLGNLDDLAKKIVEEGKLTHELSPEQMKMVMDKIEQVKPKIGPGTVIGAAMLAGAGAPIGAAIAKKTTDVGEKVLRTDLPGNPFRERQDSTLVPEPVHAPVAPSLAPMGGFVPIPKGDLFR